MSFSFAGVLFSASTPAVADSREYITSGNQRLLPKPQDADCNRLAPDIHHSASGYSQPPSLLLLDRSCLLIWVPIQDLNSEFTGLALLQRLAQGLSSPLRQVQGFHHGKFVVKLREAALKAKGVDVIEATATELMEDPHDAKRIIGVHAKKPTPTEGGGDNFRKSIMGESGFNPMTRSHFVGAVLEDVTLPIPQHGTAALIPEHDTRIFIDVLHPLPQDLPAHIPTNIVPQLPESAVRTAILRKTASVACPTPSSPLSSRTGTRARTAYSSSETPLNDVVLLRDQLISIPDYRDAKRVNQALKAWHWARKPLSSTVNILAFALYDLFGAEDDLLEVLRAGCFAYFERGG
ncbi:hypothetical protein D9611_005937 [Ephemerocybe angulata]|uniref:Squalene monooxygenase n=1 Tax=Ephemerocybe angulata TaxID=980116 RepID=A0A8H5CH78_9AGAR|nr:hypothetical protein D9611_005937 [Tulosesus angulatus]